MEHGRDDQHGEQSDEGLGGTAGDQASDRASDAGADEGATDEAGQGGRADQQPPPVTADSHDDGQRDKGEVEKVAGPDGGREHPDTPNLPTRR